MRQRCLRRSRRERHRQSTHGAHRAADRDDGRPSEEGEIRRSLEPLRGTRSMSFQLGARTLAVDAETQQPSQGSEAIRKVGFDPQPLTAAHAPAAAAWRGE